MNQSALAINFQSLLSEVQVDKDMEEALQNPSVLRHYINDGVLGLGETYMQGQWDTARLDQFMYHAFTRPGPDYGNRLWLTFILHRMKERLIDAQAGLKAFNIGREHYDIGNDLFKAMLDKGMSYTGGYWAEAATLEEAQTAKLELICRKLDLKPGMHILDIGCGWGNFAKYAAENYGVAVTGVTVSKEQAEEATKLCQGLPVEIKLQDYRSLVGQFDHIVSIEMIEAVGRKNLPVYYSTVERLLKDNGRFLLQVISTETCSRRSNRRVDQFLLWILKYIFPDGYLPKATELADAGGTKLIPQAWENFGPDYDKTLMAWGENFNTYWGALKDNYGEDFKRRWNFYLYSCAALFRARLVHLYQIVYSKNTVAGA
ncbi:cyclopropane fatty acyl phospholipid synthase [Oligoflexia bacterium]|nr:cyclopropane fatty acyl phospholipid synthase [Oligoflexia bacterium]